MSALHELLTFVLGYDPSTVRREHDRQTQEDLEACKRLHEGYRRSLEDEPLRKLLYGIRRNRSDE